MEDREKEVIRELQKNPKGFTMTELASHLSTTRHTVSVLLAKLEGQGYIAVRQAGMAKIHYWVEHQPEKEHTAPKLKEYSSIIHALQKNSQGYTVSELASELNITRNTVSIILSYLEGTESITVRQAGMAKIHYWKAKKS